MVMSCIYPVNLTRWKDTTNIWYFQDIGFAAFILWLVYFGELDRNSLNVNFDVQQKYSFDCNGVLKLRKSVQHALAAPIWHITYSVTCRGRRYQQWRRDEAASRFFFSLCISVWRSVCRWEVVCMGWLSHKTALNMSGIKMEQMQI